MKQPDSADRHSAGHCASGSTSTVFSISWHFRHLSISSSTTTCRWSDFPWRSRTTALPRESSRARGTESAISDFEEYTVISPGRFAKYLGFTDDEVKTLCLNAGVDYGNIRDWYDGYSLGKGVSIYNPYSVMSAIDRRAFGSYWKKTSAAETLNTYVGMNYDGLQDDIIRLIAGEPLDVKVDNFNNDVKNFRNKDDILTLLIHLGYLAYDENEKTASIPNKEVQLEFESLIETPADSRLYELINVSEKLLTDTLAVLKDYTGEIGLVGINYDEKKKVHSCKIERAEK